MKARVLPGVSVEVIKEIVPKQLYSTGVVGLIGTAEFGKANTMKAFSSYKELKTEFGEPDKGTLVKEARLMFLNGVSEVFAVRVGGEAGRPASVDIKSKQTNKKILKIVSKREGEEDNNVKVKVQKPRSKLENHFDIEIIDDAHPERNESWPNLVMDSRVENYVVNKLAGSRLVKAESSVETQAENALPQEEEYRLDQGKSPKVTETNYEDALQQLELEPNIDVVYACDEGNRKIHRLVNAHCENMSLSSEGGALGPRIGIGSVAPGEDVKTIGNSLEFVSDRFIVVAPYGFAGAVAGLISKLNYYESPTFKPLNIVDSFPERRYTISEQKELLTRGVMPIDLVRGRGVIAVKGITTSNEQISVQRIAHQAVRGVKNISDNFIGTLNNATGRMALRERIREFLTAMEKEGAIVPTTDGQKPAFLVDVYSSQDDFAKGIVHADIAVRPVRAIDYIYSTITVQAY